MVVREMAISQMSSDRLLPPFIIIIITVISGSSSKRKAPRAAPGTVSRMDGFLRTLEAGMRCEGSTQSPSLATLGGE